VLFETGYALARLGSSNVVLVFNKALGRVEDLPFDLRARRILTYECSESDSKADARNALARGFSGALKPILVKLGATGTPPLNLSEIRSGIAARAADVGAGNRAVALRGVAGA